MVNTINTLTERNKELESLKKELKEYKEASISLIADQRKRIAKETAEIRELKQEVKELTVFKEQIKELEKKTVDILTKVKKEEDQEITY